MGLFDIVRGYVERVRSSFSEKIPLDDFGGDFDSLDDGGFGYVEGYDTGGFSEIVDTFDIIEEAGLEDRFIEDFDEAQGGEYVTEFYDAFSAQDYVETSPGTVLRVFVDFDGEEPIFHVYRFDTG